MNTQINIALPKEWKEELERLAGVYSVDEVTTLTYLDLIRRVIKEKYGGNFISTIEMYLLKR